jgi:hypothetical protein
MEQTLKRQTNPAGRRTPLFWAALGHPAVVNELLSPNDSNGATSRGANIEAKNYQGETPLHNASCNGRLLVVKVLVSGGANILARNNDGGLPIQQAVNYETQKWPIIYFSRFTQQPVVSLSTNSWKTSRGLVIPTVVMIRHFVKRFTGMCWVRMMSWRSLSIWSAETLHCSILVTMTVHCHST